MRTPNHTSFARIVIKGRYILDIRKYLTGGCTNSHGHAHIHVHRGQQHAAVAGRGVLEFHPVQFEDQLHVQMESTLDEAEPQRTLRLMRLLQSASSQVSMPSPTTPVCDGTPSPTSRVEPRNCLRQPRSGKECDRQDQGIDTGESSAASLRPQPRGEVGPQSSSRSSDAMAMFRPSSTQCAAQQSPRTHAQSAAVIHSKGGKSGFSHSELQCRDGGKDAGPTGDIGGMQDSHSHHLPPSNASGDARLLHTSQSKQQLGASVGSKPAPSAHQGFQRGRDCGADGDGRAAESQSGSPRCGSELKRLPLHVGSQLVTFMTLMTASLTNYVFGIYGLGWP